MLRLVGRPWGPFAQVWLGESISQFGAQASVLAIPLTAASTLGATPGQMGLLRAAGFAPSLLLGLLAGVWVDRMARRRVLIFADLGRALALGVVPTAAWFGLLGLEPLYAVTFAVGVMSVVSDAAQTAFVPSLVPRDELANANSRLELSRWAAQIGGPGVAGALVQAVGAPLAVAADAASLLISALLLVPLRVASDVPTPRPAGHGNVWREAREGLQVVLCQPLQRALVACAATYNFFGYIQATVLVLYVTRELMLPVWVFASTFAAFGVGGFLGALAAPRLARWRGVTVAIFGGALVAASGDCLVALAGPPLPTTPVLLIGRFLAGAGIPLFVVNAVSLRQAITPAPLLGRVAAGIRSITWGVLPIGALLGGLLGERIGLRGTLEVAAVGSLMAAVWLLPATGWRPARRKSGTCGDADDPRDLRQAEG